ncbi:RNA polymerase sigma factor [Myxococcota bacterium]|nr:RNA polymerase sigma factor [Myxococcota bacterium]
MAEATDEELLGAYARGDREAFRTLFERYAPRLKAYALRLLRNRGLADDVASEAMVRVASHPERWEGRGSVRAYLFTVAHRLCIDSLRERRRDQLARDRVVDITASLNVPPSPEAEAMLGQVAGRLEAAVAALPAPHREVLLLRVVHGLSGEETAAVVGLDESQVRSQLSYARKQIRESLTRVPASEGRRAWGEVE